MGRRTTLYLGVLACLTILAVPAWADPLGVLPNHPDAYNDGNGLRADGAWASVTSFSNGALNGQVEWAVFEAEDFPFDTGEGGWTPAAGQLVYVYQVFSTGTAVVSGYSVPVLNEASNDGSFEDDLGGIDGIAPVSHSLSVGNMAQWNFDDPNKIGQGEHSIGLTYCSPNTPTNIWSAVVDSGMMSIAIPVPTPSSEAIPEPGTLALLAVGLGSMLFTGTVRRRRTR
ncbi:MAG TPA: PEP-CTERM sorting domain-containing protein [Thermoguttaceae bacterium]|nr:PEP-CTERM sorting domain-containing protein [Thermoguttaceae bacterium]